ncbi:MAG TPA: UbiX family flavin prenyltransferase, partial [Blastocatellia bacterium]|nr:UbiX family flavin prenyltransferase [Blastocatellia bacterium]
KTPRDSLNPSPCLCHHGLATIPAVKSITVGISGASGAVYAQRLLVHLEESAEVGQINLVVSGPGRRVISDELDISPKADSEQLVSELIGRPSSKTLIFHAGDIGAAIASGSYPVDAMVVVPCSASTMGVLASGSCRNLLHRAADVSLKEGRKLVLVIRETPLSLIHLENMITLKRAGAVIIPAMPAFYHRPADIISLVDHFVYRVLDHLGLQHSQATTWQGEVHRTA